MCLATTQSLLNFICRASLPCPKKQVHHFSLSFMLFFLTHNGTQTHTHWRGSDNHLRILDYFFFNRNVEREKCRWITLVYNEVKYSGKFAENAKVEMSTYYDSISPCCLDWRQGCATFQNKTWWDFWEQFVSLIDKREAQSDCNIQFYFIARVAHVYGHSRLR